MMARLVLKRPQEKWLVDRLCHLLEGRPDDWSFDRFHAVHSSSGNAIWIANGYQFQSCSLHLLIGEVGTDRWPDDGRFRSAAEINIRSFWRRRRLYRIADRLRDKSHLTTDTAFENARQAFDVPDRHFPAVDDIKKSMTA